MRSVLLSYGFRPFFLLAGIYAPIATLPWLHWLAAGKSPLLPDAALWWHGHEMLLGFAVAVIAGFFLTAVPNWTGTEPARGGSLLALVLLWLAGRVAMWLAVVLPAWLVAAIDFAFLPALAAALAGPIWRAGAKRNLFVVPLLLLFAAANALVHLGRIDPATMTASEGLTLATGMIVLLMVVIGGRVTPAFTINALRRQGIETPPIAAGRAIDRIAIAATVLWLAADLSGVALAAGIAALLAAAANAARMTSWRGARTVRDPILLVLHLGYAWIAAGLALRGAAWLWGWPSLSDALHALTLGAIGTYTLGMMSRVALGHTGRPLAVRPAIAVAYALVSAAALVRIVGPTLASGAFALIMQISGAFWIAAWAIFCSLYLPILVRPRPDGGAG